MKKWWGIWFILLFAFTGCAAIPVEGEVFETLTEGDLYFMEGTDYRVILTDLSLPEIEQFYRDKYANRFILDEKTDNALFFTVRAQPSFRVAVTPNDLSDGKVHAILITVGDE